MIQTIVSAKKEANTVLQERLPGRTCLDKNDPDGLLLEMTFKVKPKG